MNTWRDKLIQPATIISAGVVLFGGIVLAGSHSLPSLPSTRTEVPILRPVSLGANPASSLRDLDNAYTSVVDSVAPGVVSITWGQGTQKVVGSGTGFLYRADGWIVTNDHVVHGHDTVHVTLADGHEYDGKVTSGHDPQYDIAVVKIDATNLPTLAFADSDKSKPGQTAIAVGSPFGLNSTVTFGHISATGRPGMVSEGGQVRSYAGLLQTDAAINPGNSGGPLLNIDGQVVGVNTMIYSSGASMFGGEAGSVGVGFAIGANVAKTIADMLIEKGAIKRAFLGAAPETLKPYEAKKLNIVGGAVLHLGAAGIASPAAKAGLKEGDVVTDIDGKAVKNEMDVRLAMLNRSAGQTSHVVYLRDGKKADATVTLSDVPKEAMQQQNPVEEEDGNGNDSDPFNMFKNLNPRGQAVPHAKAKLGAGVSELDDTARAQFKIPSDVKGVVITSFDANSLAKNSGFEIGDVITDVNGKGVTSIAELKSALDGADRGLKVTAKNFSQGSVVNKSIMVN